MSKHTDENKPMTDAEAIRLGKRIDQMNEQMRELCQKFLEHPNGETMFEYLDINGFINHASAEGVVTDYLVKPRRKKKKEGKPMKKRGDAQ